MKRLLAMCAVIAALVLPALTPPLSADKGGSGSARLQLVEATVTELQKALQTKLITSEQLVRMYLARIDAYESTINAFIHLDRDNALAQARQADALRRPGVARSPLYGIPVLLKDNIDTADMPTTAGSRALRGSRPPDDAFIAGKLREAGAIIIGKATLTEFANFIAVGMPTGFSGLGRFGFNPYDPRVDPRDPIPLSATVSIPNDGRPVLQTGGSSSGSGIGVNANLTTVAIGTETSGSILSPANANGIAGIKPTVGLVSRDGIIPITADQDMAGPLTRTVTDAAILLGAVAGFDPDDSATAACLTPGNCFSDYTRFLDKKALKGARLAVFSPATPLAANRQALLDAAINVMRQQGAQVTVLPVDAIPAQLGSCVTTPLLASGQCSSVLTYGFKRDLNAYLAATPAAPEHTLGEVIERNNELVAIEGQEIALKYGQQIALAAQALDTSANSADTARYRADRELDLANSRDVLNAIYNGPDGRRGTSDDVDAIIAVGNTFAAAPAKAGFPSVTVPGGFMTAIEGVDPPINGLFPQTITFSGPAFSEPRLIALAYAFEQATQHRLRHLPPSTPPLASDFVTRR